MIDTTRGRLRYTSPAYQIAQAIATANGLDVITNSGDEDGRRSWVSAHTPAVTITAYTDGEHTIKVEAAWKGRMEVWMTVPGDGRDPDFTVNGHVNQSDASFLMKGMIRLAETIERLSVERLRDQDRYAMLQVDLSRAHSERDTAYMDATRRQDVEANLSEQIASYQRDADAFLERERNLQAEIDQLRAQLGS